jgi:hypothetical protein
LERRNGRNRDWRGEMEENRDRDKKRDWREGWERDWREGWERDWREGWERDWREGWERDWREERERGLIRRKGKGWKEGIKQRTGTGIGAFTEYY